MTISKELKFAPIDELFLDPFNPRLGRENTGSHVSQERILELMSDWTLEELATSFLENGFWTQEALIVVQEPLNGNNELIVVEGNRRLAALRLLRRAFEGKPIDKGWRDLIKGWVLPAELFEQIPYIEASSRDDVAAFLGFRHVTGIKEWRPAEKAEFISKLIETRKMTYEEVMRKIGSKTTTVRQNYIAYRLLLQMEAQADISTENVEEKFSVLYLSLRTPGTQKYLNIDLQASPEAARQPVPQSRLGKLSSYAKWLFGDKKTKPIFTDSREVNTFSQILLNAKAVRYLESTSNPVFDVAKRMLGNDEEEVVGFIITASNNIELALSRAHLFTTSKDLKSEVIRLSKGTLRLLDLFPEIRDELFGEKK